MFPAALFDYNGVLVDDEAVHFAAFNLVLAELGLEISEAAYVERYLGYDDRGAFHAILEDGGRRPTSAEIDELVLRKKPRYLELARAGLKTFPGAAALLRAFAEQGPVGIVSGALRAEIELGLDTLGAREHVEFIVAAEDTERCKPDPEGYLYGVEELQRRGTLHAERALVIEDSLAGIEAAKRAGLDVVAVAHSYSRDELRDAGALLVVPDLAAISLQQLRELYAQRYG